MAISIFELFSIGIGPSSSHTVGPMSAALDFVQDLQQQGVLSQVSQLSVDLYGSLALTGKGHGTDKAILNGLEGKAPDTVKPETMVPRMQHIIDNKTINLAGEHTITFDYAKDLRFLQKEFLEKHSNGMRFTAYDADHNLLKRQIYFSIGGGFICRDEDFDTPVKSTVTIPYSFDSCEEMIALAKDNDLSIAELMLANERCWRDESEVKAGVLNIAKIMQDCIEAGCRHSGELPGGLHIKRRAPDLYNKLIKKQGRPSNFEQADVMNHLNLYAMAVNEENAAGGRIVTAPTNGAAGIIPAVLAYYQAAHDDSSDDSIITYLLTSAAIAILYKKGASISGAEVGCQGEVGVAASMAAAGLTAILGGSIEQIENAAEIAMEHHLGMTCDPVAGLVQVPCIERNAMGSVKAVNAARMALIGDGQHLISLDKVIATMKQTGEDMKRSYKETSEAGLALAVTVGHSEC